MTRFHRVRPFHICTLVAGLLVGLLASPLPLHAQTFPPPSFDGTLPDDIDDWSDEVPAHIAVVDGEGWLHRDGINEAAAENTPLLAGDRLQTGRGRVEVLFADGSVLALDEQTEAVFLSDELLRLDRGRMRLELARAGGAAGYRVDAVGTTTWIRAAGEYRIQINDRGGAAPDVQLLVIRGTAEIGSNRGRTLVRAGYEATASALAAPSLPYAVTVSTWDGFDRWWDARRNERTGFSSAQYLPTEIAYYGGVLDRHGDWGYEPSVGYVWYPRVDVAWQPYAAGRWSFVGTYGWVWIGADRWAWPTHHYGRWGVSGRRYYWIPGRRWAPAWVSWTSAPGYVGWCPLGFDNRAIVSVNIGYTNGWRGWSYAPAGNFHTRVVIANRGRHLPPRDARFVEGYRAPIRPAGVVARNNAGLRGPAGTGRSSVAVPRWTPRTDDRTWRAPESQQFRGDRRSGPASDGRVAPEPRRPASAAGVQQPAPAGRTRLSNVPPSPSSSPSEVRGDVETRQPAARPSSQDAGTGARPRWSAPATTESVDTRPVRQSPRSLGTPEQPRAMAPSRVQRPSAVPPPVDSSAPVGRMPAPGASSGRERVVAPTAPAGRQLRTMPASPASESAPPQRSRERTLSTPAPVERTGPAAGSSSSRPSAGYREQARERSGEQTAPSRAPRAEPSRQAPERQPSATRESSGSDGGRARPRSR